jgi:hypothetical protein
MGRSSLRVAGVLTVFALSAAGCDWPVFGYGPAHTGYNPFERTVGVANVATLHESWRAQLGTSGGSTAPVVVNGVVYATSVAVSAPQFQLEAFDAAGVNGCSGTPKTCTPQWTALLPGGAQSLNVSNGVVYVGTAAGMLAAYDASGVKGCGGSPKTCSPLWRASGVSGERITVAGQWVYADAESGGQIQAFDAAGQDGCSGAPKMCVPQWTAVGSYPAVANGKLYTSGRTADGYEVRAYDALGVSGCSGSPKTCTPYWIGRQANIGIFNWVTPPTVANGYVWIGVRTDSDPGTSGGLFGFDATGAQNCSGTPKVCTPNWRAPTDAVDFPPAVAGNTLYTTSRYLNGSTFASSSRLLAFDIASCTDVHALCTPTWSADIGFRPQGYGIANGVVYLSNVGGGPLGLMAFDAAGHAGCSGSPRTCTPLSSMLTSAVPTSPVIVNGNVYFATYADNVLHAYKP